MKIKIRTIFILYVLVFCINITHPLQAKNIILAKFISLKGIKYKKKYWKSLLNLKNYFNKHGLFFVNSNPDIIICDTITNDILQRNIPIILLERRSSGSLRQSSRNAIKNSLVKAIFKNRTLKDTNLYNIPAIQDCYHFNLINANAQFSLKIETPELLTHEELHKIHCIICSPSNSPFSEDAKKLKNIFVDFNKKRPIDVFYAGRVNLVGNSPARKLYIDLTC